MEDTYFDTYGDAADDFDYTFEYDEGGYEDYEPNPYDGTYSEE